MISKNATYTLNNGKKIPIIGFGTWQIPDGQLAKDSVLHALEAGYVHIDTAAVYRNEASVGDAIIESKIKRESLYITTKLWNDNIDYRMAKAAIKESLTKLQLDYLDLYLIHWPNPKPIRDAWQNRNSDVWIAMEEAVEEGLIKSIGVSNFREHHLKALLEYAKIVPAVNQIYLNPSDQQEAVVKFSKKHGLLLEAYSPLGTGSILDDVQLNKLAATYNKTASQLAIRWSLQKGYLPLPKSANRHRIFENINVFDFEISDTDMKVIDGYRGIGKLAPDADIVEY
jgi:diketogulonate reductase-like aldo/keto reductase